MRKRHSKSQQREARTSYQEGITCYDSCNNVFVSSPESFVREPMYDWSNGDGVGEITPQVRLLASFSHLVNIPLQDTGWRDLYPQEDDALKVVQAGNDIHSIHVIRNS
uniref:Uncharacterized protein n=1 Tax=Timema poppense TaxID=170557 RepID=A0A7R9HE06_TIMPO|nr:unnamed protein product [Timema poppensis]